RLFVCPLLLRPPLFPLFPYTTLFRSIFPVDVVSFRISWFDRSEMYTLPAVSVHTDDGFDNCVTTAASPSPLNPLDVVPAIVVIGDRKSTRLNSSHVAISYAVFCLKKK